MSDTDNGDSPAPRSDSVVRRKDSVPDAFRIEVFTDSESGTVTFVPKGANEEARKTAWITVDETVLVDVSGMQ